MHAHGPNARAHRGRKGRGAYVSVLGGTDRRESDERIAKISENLPPEEGMGEPQLTRETKK